MRRSERRSFGRLNCFPVTLFSREASIRVVVGNRCKLRASTNCRIYDAYSSTAGGGRSGMGCWEAVKDGSWWRFQCAKTRATVLIEKPTHSATRCRSFGSCRTLGLGLFALRYWWARTMMHFSAAESSWRSMVFLTMGTPAHSSHREVMCADDNATCWYSQIFVFVFFAEL
jgi:hypothetical protein